MSLRNSTTSWGLVARLLHWLFLVLVIGAWVAIEVHEQFPKGSPERAEWMRIHFSIGITVFVLIWVRLGWRLSEQIPDPVPGPRWQQQAASLVHLALYGVLIAMPLAGLLTMQFSNRVVAWFGVVDIPVFLAPSKAAAELMEEIHTDVLWPTLLALVAVHAGAALWHHFREKDDTLRRMTFPRD